MQLIRASVIGLVALCASTAAADESSGTWTGAVEARGNYYWEESTRVVAPELNLELQSPNGVHFDGHYLVDSITSASQAAGTVVDQRFTELRHELSGAIGRELTLADDTFVDFTVGVRTSTEPDWGSVGGNLAATLALNERSTEFTLSTAFTHDDISSNVRGATGPAVCPDPAAGGTMDGITTSASWNQVLSPSLSLETGYVYSRLSGYLQNVYRCVSVGPALMQEHHPGRRHRHLGFARLAWFNPSTLSAVHLVYRAYVDSWEVAAINPELRLYQHFGDDVMLRLKYRFYTQTRAEFFQPARQYTPLDEFITADLKLAEFHSHKVGAMVLLHLWFLDQTPLDFAWESTVELGVELLFNSDSDQDAVIAQAGVRVPF